MSELKPCPFCGGEAEMLTAESMHGGNLYGVMCNCCACRTDVFDNEAEAIAAWNTQAERTCHNISEDGFLCSVCSFGDFGSFKFEPRFCPNCGARVTPKNSETTPKVVSE